MTDKSLLRIHKLYRATNTINDKKYFGQTHLTLEERFKTHMWSVEYDSDLHFHRAIKKYGIEAFDIDEIVNTLTQHDIDALEIEFINKFKTYIPEFGYNMTMGGDGCKATWNTRALISAGKHDMTIDEIAHIHKIVITMYNAREVGYAEINKTTKVIAGDAKTIIAKHRTKNCATCFHEDKTAIDESLIVTRKPSSKPDDFGNKVAGWKKGSHYTREQRIAMMLRTRKTTLEQARITDAEIIAMKNAGKRLVDIMKSLNLKQCLVAKIIQRHSTGTCPLCH